MSWQAGQSTRPKVRWLYAATSCGVHARPFRDVPPVISWRQREQMIGSGAPIAGRCGGVRSS